MIELKYEWAEVDNLLNRIVVNMFRDGWKPDCIVSTTLDSIVPSVLLSKKLNCEFHMNTGYDFSKYGNILIFQDFNQLGNTLGQFVHEFKTKNNIKFAALVHNEASVFDVDYAGYYINELDSFYVIEFPWNEYE